MHSGRSRKVQSAANTAYSRAESIDGFARIVKSLSQSSLKTLEELGLDPSASTEGIMSLLTTFPNLKEIDFGRVKMYLQGMKVSPQVSSVQSAADLDIEKAIVQEWGPLANLSAKLERGLIGGIT